LAVAAASASPMPAAPAAASMPAVISALQQVVQQLSALVQQLQAAPSLQQGTAATAGAAVGADALGGGATAPAAGGCACCGDAVSGAKVAQDDQTGGANGAPQAKVGKGKKDKGGHGAPTGGNRSNQAPTSATPTAANVGPSNFDNLKRKNPKTVAQMIERVKNEAAHPSQDWTNLCGHFSAWAYGWSSSGQNTAALQWSNSSDKHSPSEQPQPGALLFYKTSNPAGHVAVYLGNGQVATTDLPTKGKVGIVKLGDIEKDWHATYLGWTPPYFPNAG
jgi:hypothetical protein